MAADAKSGEVKIFANKKASYICSNDVKVIYEGSKTLWRLRLSIDIYMINHKRFHVIEIVCYNPVQQVEAPRLYLSPAKLRRKLDSKEIEEKIKIRNEFLVRQKKFIPNEEIVEEVMEDQLINYVVSKLNVTTMSDNRNAQFEVSLPQVMDHSNPSLSTADEIFCLKPDELQPLQIVYKKMTT